MLQGGQPPAFLKTAFAVMPIGISHQGKYRKGEVVYMSTYEVLTLLFLGGGFLITLLAYLDGRYKKRKK